MNAFLKPAALSRPEPKYPLRLSICANCRLVQLPDRIPPKLVFGRNYNYLSGSTEPLLSYFDSLADAMVRRFRLTKDEKVCDIGSNDGSFLSFFQSRGLHAVGVEPTPIPAKISRTRGIKTLQAFFTAELAEKIRKSLGPMRVITAMNVIAHTGDLHSFMSGVLSLMTEDTIFVVQSHYLPALMDKLEYDTIYHEHLRYYTLSVLERLHHEHGLQIFDAAIKDVYGGSILVYSSLKRRTPTTRVAKILRSEKRFNSIRTYRRFHTLVKGNSDEFRRLLLSLRSKGKSIVGIGAPMKASTLLNYAEVGPETIDFMTEVNRVKVGTYLPGMHIPIVNESALFKKPSDYAVIFSWNIGEQIMSKLTKLGYKGRFIVPIPRPRIVGT
jgi:hypothetical protein